MGLTVLRFSVPTVRGAYLPIPNDGCVRKVRKLSISTTEHISMAHLKFNTKRFVRIH